MNTNALKKFAQAARKKLLNQVGSKLEQVIITDSVELREKTEQIKRLQEEINKIGKKQVIDKVAYTWFNRLMALRFMDANDYQPIGIRVVTPKTGYTLPELLDEAKQGNIPEELPVKKQRVFDLLDGRIPSSNPQNEAYKELLIGTCNHLSNLFPFLFERIDDYSELLLPDDITSEFSIVQDIRDGMSIEDCKEVEIIGWLYQFYISEKKDEVFASKSKIKKEDIPAATQLFTPRWIVEYMVQNTVGKLWLQNRPNSKLKDHMLYFINSPSLDSGNYLKINSVEDLTLLDQACGSGHILVYAFELFTKIYEEEGYNQSEIPKLIIEKNLHGFEIDERAAQLAGFTLMMKARAYQKRVFRQDIDLNILCFSDLALSRDEIKESLTEIEFDPSDQLLHDLKNLKQATNFGSLILPCSSKKEIEDVLDQIKSRKQDFGAFQKYKLIQLTKALNHLIALSKKYCCVVDNPPYMGSGNMNKELSEFVKTSYPDSKSDLMACFMESGLKMIQPSGFLGMINQHSWMFLSSYEKLRVKLIREIFFDTLLHLGPRTFPEISGEVVQNASFTFWNSNFARSGSYFRLINYDKSELKRFKTIEAIKSPNLDWYYLADQQDNMKIPGNPIAYWISKKEIEIYINKQVLSEYSHPAKGIDTGENDFFLRFWYEISDDNFDKLEASKRWTPYNKGGEFRRWYGNREFVLRWEKGVFLLERKNWDKRKPTLRNQDKWFQEGYTWSTVSSGGFSARYCEKGALFDNGGCTLFAASNLHSLGGFVNSKVASRYFEFLSPTLNFQPGGTGALPIKDEIFSNKIDINQIKKNINISKLEWDSKEKSWNFIQNELLRNNLHDIEDSFKIYKQFWKNKFFNLHRNEEELNSQFIEIYDLQDKLTPDVALADITILKEEIDSKKLKRISDKYSSGWKLENRQWKLETVPNQQPDLPYIAKEVFAQFVSYAVGCIFGRYSLDKEGLILANQGESLEDYLNKVGYDVDGLHFLPDDDNIIPILDDEWFEDDIVGRFHEFLKASFGKENFEKNLAFVEDCLGKDIRKFFVKDFYFDHIKRYKKRPIYWMFSSPNGSFNVLIYMHRYTPDTLNQILNGYLKEYREKLKTRIEQLDHIIETGGSTEQVRASKEKDRLRVAILELQEYERDILFPLATERIQIDLDDGVLVNYNKFGKAIKEVSGLNDKKTKAQVKEFDWIDPEQIR